jgi:hypothetical protein
MDKGTELPKPTKEAKRRGRGKVIPRVSIVEKTISADVPPGSRFKGHEPFLVQDLVISVCATCYQRELGHVGWVDDPGTVTRRD